MEELDTKLDGYVGWSPRATYMVGTTVMSGAVGVDMTSTPQWSLTTPHCAWLRTILPSVARGLGPKVPISRVAYAFVT